MFAKLEARMDQIEEMIRHAFRVGTVVSTNPAAGTARVQLADADGLVSFDLPVMQRQTLKNKDYAMPDAGEHVLCTFLPFGVEQGFVLGSIYSTADVTPVADPDKRHVEFEDGTWLQYDRKTHSLSGVIKSGSVRLLIEGAAQIEARRGAVVKSDGVIQVDAGDHAEIRSRNPLQFWTPGTQVFPYSPIELEEPEK
ncbi:phage baseplate assembly protein V [Solidesulfovibrio sp.]